MLNNKKIAVIGAGHMGRALIGGMLRGKLAEPKQITATRRDEEARNELKRHFNINATPDNRKAIAGADIIIIAVKPPMAKAVLTELAPRIKKNQLLISVM